MLGLGLMVGFGCIEIGLIGFGFHQMLGKLLPNKQTVTAIFFRNTAWQGKWGLELTGLDIMK